MNKHAVIQFFLAFSLIFALNAAAQEQPASSGTEIVRVDLAAPSTPFPHFWEQMFGSGRANLTMRDAYRRDLDWTREITAFKYVRFHAIFHDENGVYDEDAQGHPIYNFSYVDQIYDGLLAHGVKPFVELGFMPKKLAGNPVLHAFWYKPSPSPPKDYGKWDALITAFAQHLVERYGLDEVGQWYFEVWNEPNIDFWAGEPKQETIEQIRKFNGCAAQGEPCGSNCTIYSSAKGAPVATFIHPFGHVYPPQVTPMIVKFFQENPR